MGQTQTVSSTAESYTWRVEIECFLPQSKVQELGINIGSYHHRYPLPAPSRRAGPPSEAATSRSRSSARAEPTPARHDRLVAWRSWSQMLA